MAQSLSPAYADKARDNVAPSRQELSATLHAINADVLRHIDVLALGTTVLQMQMYDGDAQAQ